MVFFCCNLQIPVEQQGDGPEKKITRLAIGVDGGFDPDAGRKKFDIKDTQQIVILPEFVTIPWPNDNLPEKVWIYIYSICISSWWFF